MPGIYVSNFARGMTDLFIPGEETRARILDNFYITDDARIRSREGSVPFDLGNSNEILPSSPNRVDSLVNFESGGLLLSHNLTKIYERDPGWTEITGPTGNSAFTSFSDPGYLSWSEWRNHLFITDQSGSSVQKLYVDDVSTTQLRNAGLPDLAKSKNYVDATLESDAITMANDLKSKFIDHYEDFGSLGTDLHDVEDTSAKAEISSTPNATDLASLITLTTDLMDSFTDHVRDAQLVSSAVVHWTKVTGEGKPVQGLDNTQAPTTLLECVARLDDLRRKYTWHINAFGLHNDDLADTTGALLGLHAPANPRLGPVSDRPIIDQGLTDILELANELKTQMNAHMSDGAVHTGAGGDDLENVVQVPDATDITTLYQLILHLRYFYDQHNQDLVSGGSHHSATTGGGSELTNSPLAEGTDLSTWVNLLNEVKNAFNSHEATSTGHGSTGTYEVKRQDASVITVVYAFHYEYEYKVGNVTHLDRGGVYTSEAVQCGEPRIPDEIAPPPGYPAVVANPITISNLPVISNGATENWDTSNITLEVYRTVDNGTVFYSAGNVTNGTTTFEDKNNDTEAEAGLNPLNQQPTLYTTGGVVSNGPTPVSKHMHILNGIGYYANVTVDGESLPYRLMQSIPNDPDSVPPTFFDDFDEDLVGVSSAGKDIVVGTDKSMYRVEGQFNQLGQGFLRHEVIAENVGLVAPSGMIKIDNLLYFPGTDGFYRTNGFQVVKISRGSDDSYASLVETSNQRVRFRVGYDKKNKRIWWAVQEDSGGSGNDKVWVFNIPTGGFTTYSNGTYFQPSALAYFNDKMLRGDERGYILEHDDSTLTDPLIDTSLAASSWGKVHIPWDFESLSTDLGSSQVRKWVNKMQISAYKRSNLSLDITSINDNGRNEVALSPILYDDGQGTPPRNGVIDEWRRFPSGSLRCNFKSLRFRNAFTEIAKSDNDGTTDRTATGGGTFTVTLNPIGAATWPAEPHEYFIYFEEDGYVQGYKIISRSSDTVMVVDDSGGNNPGAGSELKWLIRGYPKDERFELIGYNVVYRYLGMTQKDFAGASSEGVGTNS